MIGHDVQCPRCERRFSLKVAPVVEKTPEEIENEKVAKTVFDRLSNNERRILHYVVEGASNKEIAQWMGTSEQVVKNYMRSIFDKTGQENRVTVSVYVADHPLLRLELEKVIAALPH